MTAAFASLTQGIRRLSTGGQDVRDLIGALGGMPVLVRLCAAVDSVSEDTIDDALVALNQLCLDEESVSEFVCYGGLQVLADLLLDEQKSVKIHSHVLEFLPRTLINEEVIVTFADLDIIPSLVKLCKATNVTLLRRNLVVLSILAQVPEIADRLMKMGILLVEPLFLICEAHFQNDLVDRASELLAHLLQSKRQQKIYLVANAPSSLIRVIAHCSRPAAKENAIHMIGYLCEDPALRKDMIDRGGLAPLIRLQQVGETEGVRKLAAVVLAQIGVAAGMKAEMDMLQKRKW